MSGKTAEGWTPQSQVPIRYGYDDAAGIYEAR
jgi:hypothetical protein